METDRQPLIAQEERVAKPNGKWNFLRIFALIVAAIFIGFGAILLADGLADADNRIPGRGKRYVDSKEIAIAGAFLLSGGMVVALSYGVLRPRCGRKSTLYRTSLALGCGLILSLAMRGLDVRFNKPHWFTTNVPVLVPTGGERYMNAEIRNRALLESLNRISRENQ